MKKPEKKFSRLYDKYVGKIYRFVYLKVESKETAEDITSQVFAKAWDKFRKVYGSNPGNSGEIKNESAYIYQIARSEIANHYRRKPQFDVISTDLGESPIADPEPTPEDRKVQESDLDLLRMNLKELGSDYQDAVIWRYLDGMSYREISEIMEKPQGTVRVMVHRGLKELKRKMEKFD